MAYDREKDLICENLDVTENGHLTINGADVTELAKEYGTPLYVMDEDRIRERCRTYLDSALDAFDGKARILLASKAASFKRLYEIADDEGLCTDVVSCGEIYTAMKAGFPLERAYFHSNNKTDADIAFAIDNGVGYFVVDQREELEAIDRIAGEKGKKQEILLRITPGIDPHTQAAISTGKVDSKFGTAIETGQAEEITRLALSLPNIVLTGFHCHVGSQVFDSDVFLRAADIMLDFIADIYAKTGFLAEQLDLGGGYGVRYLSSQPHIDIADNIFEVAACVKAKCEELQIERPLICFEPGRSMVADAGLTVYTAGSVKKIPGYINYVSVDGSMADNVRYAMYEAPYTVVPADNMFADRDLTATVAGRCCESGDIIQKDVCLPSSTTRGSLIAVLTTGAYNYSMASNYNRLTRPPIVMVKDGRPYLAVRRETLDDIIACDL